MVRQIDFIGAVTNLGLRPYDDGSGPRAVDQAAAVYRDLGLVERLGARDRGDVVGLPYRDLAFTAGRARNEDLILEHARRLADAVAATPPDAFPLVVGGECSILLGTLRGVRGRGRVGLAFVDGHADFAIPATTVTGSIAGMDLALAVGRGGYEPLVREEDVVIIGRRAEDAPDSDGITVIDADDLDGAAERALRILEPLDGFFIHLDVDVLDSRLMPAVDSPDPGGLSEEELVAVLRPLVHHPRALGMEVTIYDPALDPDRVCGRRIVEVLEKVFAT